MPLPSHVIDFVDNLMDAASVVDRNLEVLYFNEEYRNLTRLRRRDRHPKPGMCHEHFGLETCNERCLSLQAFDTSKRQRYTGIPSVRLEGRFDFNAFPILTDENGVVQAVLEQYRDVTAETDILTKHKRLLEQERANSEIIARQREELREANALLRLQLGEVSLAARTDGLTGVANRRYFDEKMIEFISFAQLKTRPVSLILFDLDFFKRVNDQYGHDMGDRTLQAFARVLKDSARDDDLVARFGGEEFVLILPGASSAEAERVGLRVQEQLKVAGLVTTTSGGIASFPEDGETPHYLLRAADRALYAAKAAGRNRIIAASRLEGSSVLIEEPVPTLVGLTNTGGPELPHAG